MRGGLADTMHIFAGGFWKRWPCWSCHRAHLDGHRVGRRYSGSDAVADCKTCTPRPATSTQTACLRPWASCSGPPCNGQHATLARFGPPCRRINDHIISDQSALIWRFLTYKVARGAGARGWSGPPAATSLISRCRQRLAPPYALHCRATCLTGSGG